MYLKFANEDYTQGGGTVIDDNGEYLRHNIQLLFIRMHRHRHNLPLAIYLFQ
jgi:hypothetical protein